MDEVRNRYRVLYRNLKKIGHLESVHLEMMIILNGILGAFAKF
jgi:hypothetical protein